MGAPTYIVDVTCVVKSAHSPSHKPQSVALDMKTKPYFLLAGVLLLAIIGILFIFKFKSSRVTVYVIPSDTTSNTESNVSDGKSAYCTDTYISTFQGRQATPFSVYFRFAQGKGFICLYHCGSVRQDLGVPIILQTCTN